jgi:protein tyrosine phosphatase (PTP) superfamily phosphohydrolase (DUF442 family)
MNFIRSRLPGVKSSINYSEITDTLYIGTTPRKQDCPLLQSQGIQLVINMRFERPPQYGLPIPVLWLPTFDTPFLPIPIDLLKRGVQAALNVFQQGGKAYAHCASGIHRGVTMGASILIAQGYSSAEAMRLIKERRAIADPYVWYIRRRIEKFAETWYKQLGVPPNPALE